MIKYIDLYNLSLYKTFQLKKFFKSLLGNKKNQNEKQEVEEDYKYLPKKDELVEERFTKNFSENGGKFLYASNKEECVDFFQKIIEENDWNEKSILCFDEKILNDFFCSFF